MELTFLSAVLFNELGHLQLNEGGGVELVCSVSTLGELFHRVHLFVTLAEPDNSHTTSVTKTISDVRNKGLNLKT